MVVRKDDVSGTKGAQIPRSATDLGKVAVVAAVVLIAAFLLLGVLTWMNTRPVSLDGATRAPATTSKSLDPAPGDVKKRP